MRSLRGWRWQRAEPAPPDYRRGLASLPEILVQPLYTRGIPDRSAAEVFLQPERQPLYPPDRLAGLTRAVERIWRALRAGEPIAIFGDYDVDGLAATALLTDALRRLGGRVLWYIPDRQTGYGLSLAALDWLGQQGARLVITVDCGISNAAEVRTARAWGLECIITDHHTPPPTLPEAIVINPRQPGCPYPFKDLTAVGLAYKLGQALLAEAPGGQAEAWEQQALALVALGTVADIAPLRDENRGLVWRGLQALNRSDHPGLRALIQGAGLRMVDAWAVGYILAPRLNAAGRLASADPSLRLLLTDNPTEAERLARELSQANQWRQQKTESVLTYALEQLGEPDPALPVLYVVGPDLPLGVLGLVASKIVERFYRPAVVFSASAGLLRGSARGTPEVHLARALQECADLLVRYGGHAQAAGLTLSPDCLPAFQERFTAAIDRQLAGRRPEPTLFVEGDLQTTALDVPVLRPLERLAPFGYGNPPPCFTSVFQVSTVGLVGGKERPHLRLRVSDGRRSWEAIGFGLGGLAVARGARVELAYRPEIREWNGQIGVRLVVEDLCVLG